MEKIMRRLKHKGWHLHRDPPATVAGERFPPVPSSLKLPKRAPPELAVTGLS